jgi:MFS family permease
VKFFNAGSLWSYKDFRYLWISSSIFVLGSSAFPIALAVTVLDAGGDATSLGLILAARVLSAVLLSPIAGVWADRLPRKTIMISADIFRGLLVFAMVFLSAPNLPHIYLALLVFGVGIGDAFGAPATQAIIPSLLPAELLPAGNVARAVVSKTATIIGPGIGGGLVFLIGGRLTFLFTAIVFVFGTLILVRIKEVPDGHEVRDRNSMMFEMREGLRTVKEIPWIAAIIAVVSVQLMVALAAETVLLPVVTRREFGTDSTFAISTAAFSVGAIISALLCVRFRVKHEGQFSIFAWAFMVIAPLALAFPVSESFVIFAYLLAGFSIGPWEAYWSAAVQREVPQELQGRVFSIDYMGSTALMPLGMALVGPAANLFGEREFLIGASVIHVLLCAVVLLVPGVKDMKSVVKKNYSQGEQSPA